MPNEIGKYIQLIQEQYALDISMYDRSFLEKSIQSRISSTLCGNFDAYLDYMAKVPGEYMLFVNQLTNSYSEFFRNPLTFDYLEQIVLPKLLENTKSRKEKEIRIWSAACASGQEAFSLAILCDELANSGNSELKFRIFATDINSEMLVIAQNGIFQSISLNRVTLKRAQTYFTQKGDIYSISPKIKNQVDFSVFDLLSDQDSCPPASIYGNFDIIFCANLLFYYEPEYRQIILKKVKHCLKPGGYLITGESERDIAKANGFSEVFQNSAIFQRTHLSKI